MGNRGKARYKNGDWFNVPLAGGKFAIGRIVRVGPRGVLLGYFFGPARKNPGTAKDVEGLRPKDAALIAIFGDLGLITDAWAIIPTDGPLDISAWKMPQFGRIDEDDQKAWRVTYFDDNPNKVLSEEECPMEAARRLPEDGLWGSGAIEDYLPILLKKRRGERAK
jgi:hypothetical protein